MKRDVMIEKFVELLHQIDRDINNNKSRHRDERGNEELPEDVSVEKFYSQC